KLLCHVGLDIDATNGEDGNTALHYASENGHLEVVRVLIERGAGIDGRNKRGETPSHLAIANAHSLQVLQYLEEMGADLEMTNGNEETHLHLAAAGHNLKIVQYLV
ncbi:ankyrin, partial [Hyaloscypha bicolor E]